MEKKQARYGKSGGQQSTSPSSSTSGQPKSSASRRRRSDSLHENFEWGFVSESNADFDDDSSWNDTGSTANSKKATVKKRSAQKTVDSASASVSGQAKPGKNKTLPPSLRKAEPKKKSPPSESSTSFVSKEQQSTLFHPDDWDDDLTLPSYGRTPLLRHAAEPAPVAPSSSVPSSSRRKEKIGHHRPSGHVGDQDRAKRPAKDVPMPPKKIVAKLPEHETKYKSVENKAVNKSVEKSSIDQSIPANIQENTPSSPSAHRKKKKPFDPQYTTIPPLPPRDRQRWDPERREYVLDQVTKVVSNVPQVKAGNDKTPSPPLSSKTNQPSSQKSQQEDVPKRVQEKKQSLQAKK